MPSLTGQGATGDIASSTFRDRPEFLEADGGGNWSRTESFSGGEAVMTGWMVFLGARANDCGMGAVVAVAT